MRRSWSPSRSRATAPRHHVKVVSAITLRGPSRVLGPLVAFVYGPSMGTRPGEPESLMESEQLQGAR